MRMLALAALTAVLASPGIADDTKSRLSGTALIDQRLSEKWGDVEVTPAKRAGDAEFMRRVTLDIVGVIPTLEEAQAFLKDRDRAKRTKLVDRLLKDPRYGRHWGDVWSGVLVGFDSERRYQGIRNTGADEIEAMFAKNMPLDQFARKVITAKGVVPGYGNPQMMKQSEAGKNYEKSAIAGYVVREFRNAGRDLPHALAGKLSKAFMGVQIQCAQCHDHPFDRWTQEEFYGMASFFTEVRVRRERLENGRQGPYIVEEGGSGRRGGMTRNLSDAQIDRIIAQRMKQMPAEMKKRFSRMSKEQQRRLIRARMGQMQRRGGMQRGRDLSIPNSESGPIKPSFISSGKGVVPGKPRREQFAEILTSPDNVQFARMAVNRYWGHFLGRGIVNPIDDFNAKNKPSHKKLLDELARDFTGHNYDLHWLIRQITSSKAYNLTSSSKAKERDTVAEKYFGLARVRTLSPEQILRSMLEAVDFGQGPMGRAMSGRSRGGSRGGTSREQMLNALTAQFRFAFSDDEGSEMVDFAGSIPSALLMMNGQVIGMSTISFRGSAMDALLKKYTSPSDRITAIFLKALSRMPTSAEKRRWTSHVRRAKGNAAYEDLMWTLLNTSEFLFNH